MTITIQILFGCFVLAVCSMLHIIVLAYAIRSLVTLNDRIKRQGATAHWILLAAAGFTAVVFAHTVQVWIWAVAFMVVDALPNISDAIYFSLVTYTTVGYGDMTLDEGTRVFGVMASVTGLLNFGLSTAFLVGLVGRLLPRFR